MWFGSHASLLVDQTQLTLPVRSSFKSAMEQFAEKADAQGSRSSLPILHRDDVAEYVQRPIESAVSTAALLL